MARYKIVGEENDFRHRNSLEINGKIRYAGEILDESEFKPASGIIVREEHPGGVIKEFPELSELESLLLTKHVEKVEDNVTAEIN